MTSQFHDSELITNIHSSQQLLAGNHLEARQLLETLHESTLNTIKDRCKSILSKSSKNRTFKKLMTPLQRQTLNTKISIIDNIIEARTTINPFV